MNDPIPKRSDGPPPRWAVLFCVGIVCAMGVVAVTRRARPTPASAASRWAAVTSPGLARTRLSGLKVVDPSPEVAYDRTQDFGQAWADVDGNGCDTRDDILRRDLVETTYRAGTRSCVVASGRMVEPYTGRRVVFSKADASAIQIDHLIPLHAAWMLGAWRWTPSERLAFANDPSELVAVDGPANQDKSDALADQWRPPDRAIWCTYAINTVAVHFAYALGVTTGEQHALASMLSGCS